MPYITQDKRDEYDTAIKALSDLLCKNGRIAGHLNYCVSKLICNLLQHDTVCYSILNSLIGAIECLKLEL